MIFKLRRRTIPSMDCLSWCGHEVFGVRQAPCRFGFSCLRDRAITESDSNFCTLAYFAKVKGLIIPKAIAILRMASGFIFLWPTVLFGLVGKPHLTKDHRGQIAGKAFAGNHRFINRRFSPLLHSGQKTHFMIELKYTMKIKKPDQNGPA